ncbi:MAG: hypothetical protein QUS14_14905, partial [Pyrinomonadaceae bacterium]|nr:hypothetical protein [Pyrinomonadaceae bacterium]
RNSSAASDVYKRQLWERAWRHFGTHFFRYNIGFYEGEVRRVTPLRIRLADLSFSKSQRRNLKRNARFRVDVSPLFITDEARSLFLRHKSRFSEGVPESINDFVPSTADASPCTTMQVSVFDDGRLIAESYFDIGERAISGIYGMFDPDLTQSGLGIFTLLKEIELARESGKEFYYLGYAYEGNSFYDYKKRFAATEVYDWQSKWIAAGEF